MVFKPEILIYNLAKQSIPSKNFFRDIIKKALKISGEKEKTALSLIFVDSENSRRLNNYWRGKNRSTSVLSFSLKENEKILGDIFLCPEEIKKQAKKFNIPLQFFYQKLIVHSLLHLYGYTHIRKKDRQEMEYLENKILKNNY